MPNCRECQKTFDAPVGRPGVSKTLFCSRACSQAFGNRRMKRGAEIYDLFYRSRFDRAKADASKVRTVMGEMAIRWREDDEAAGRTDLACHTVDYIIGHLYGKRDLMPSKNLYLDRRKPSKNTIAKVSAK